MSRQTTRISASEQLFILNEENELITNRFIDKIFKKYGINHRVNKLSLYVEATTHTSYCVYKCQQKQNQKDIYICPIDNPARAIPLMENTYERLEFLGDSIMHCVLADYLFHRYPDQFEGFMTKLRTKLENTSMLAKFARILGLDQYAIISRYVEANEGRTRNDHIMEDIFEAFIGAFYDDVPQDCDKGSNYNKCRQLIVRLIEDEIDIAELLYNETNYKDMLLQYAHKMRWPDPMYGTRKVTTAGTDMPRYEMYVKINNVIYGVGAGVSKKKGEQMAAKEALENCGVIGNDSDDSDDEYVYNEYVSEEDAHKEDHQSANKKIDP